MKLSGVRRSHDEAVRYARELAASLDEKDLARDYLYGVAHNIPAYTTALACYYYIRNPPEHVFEKSFIGTTARGDVYNECCCEICRYHSAIPAEPKMQFWDINLDMAFFYLMGRIGFTCNLNTAITYLEEYKKLGKPETSSEDLERFMQIMDYVGTVPENTTSAGLRRHLKKSGLLKLTMEQLESFVDMLGYLNILHSPDSFGVTAGHTKERDMLPPLSERTYSAYPVNRWTRKHGVDHNSIHMLFGDLY